MAVCTRDGVDATLICLQAKRRRFLQHNQIAAGRRKVCEEFITRHLGDDVPERKILYEDPQLGFCILGHVYQGAKESQPHDHGPSWAIYGQARGETVMSDWAVLQRPTENKPGKVQHAGSYPLKPGMAHVYNEGDVHSPRRDGPTRLIRIEGTNMDKARRLPYEKA
jgi:hypothetical protein